MRSATPSRLQPHLSEKFYFIPGRYKVAAPLFRNDAYATRVGFFPLVHPGPYHGDPWGGLSFRQSAAMALKKNLGIYT